MDKRARIRQYYADIDRGDVPAACGLFSEDASYRRGSLWLLDGSAIKNFYENERQIASGRHTIKDMLECGDFVLVDGYFEGFLKDGRQVKVFFFDHFRFKDDTVTFRITTFPGEEI